MSDDVGRLAEEQAKLWSGIAPPNAAAGEFASGLAAVIAGLERVRGDLHLGNRREIGIPFRG